MIPVDKPILVVEIIKEKNDKLLLVKRNNDPLKGYFSFPRAERSLWERM